MVGRFLTTPGGKGANQAVAAARLGATVRFVGKVGADPFGEAARDNLRRYGVDEDGRVWGVIRVSRRAWR